MRCSNMKKLLLAFALFLLPISAEAANRFAVCTTTCTWDGASTAMWSATTGGATGASVPGSADAVILDAATCVGGTTCTVTVNTTVTVQSITMGACTAATTGCILDFSVNNNNATLSVNFSITGTGTRNLKLGSGTFSLTGVNSAVWDATTTTGLTFNAGTSTITWQPSAFNGNSNFNTGALTYATITLGGAGFNVPITLNNNGATVGNLNLVGPLRVNLPSMTISNAIAWAGTSSGLLNILNSSSATISTITLNAGSDTIAWAAMGGLTFATNTPVATNSFNMGNVINATITNPSVGGGGGHIIGG